jgi:hypothetical protein
MEQERKNESESVDKKDKEDVDKVDKKEEEASAPVFAIGGGSDSDYSEEN